jgi:hypothetical protein
MIEYKKVSRWYLFVAIANSSICLIASVAIMLLNVSTFVQLIAGLLMIPLIVGFTLFHLGMLIYFLSTKTERLACLLSSLYVIDFAFSYAVGDFLLKNYGMEAGQNLAGNLAGMIFPAISLVLAVKLLKRG